jgi:hypothetical protein
MEEIPDVAPVVALSRRETNQSDPSCISIGLSAVLKREGDLVQYLAQALACCTEEEEAKEQRNPYPHC